MLSFAILLRSNAVVLSLSLFIIYCLPVVLSTFHTFNVSTRTKRHSPCDCVYGLIELKNNKKVLFSPLLFFFWYFIKIFRILFKIKLHSFLSLFFLCALPPLLLLLSLFSFLLSTPFEYKRYPFFLLEKSYRCFRFNSNLIS